jgi:hypothetical protein
MKKVENKKVWNKKVWNKKVWNKKVSPPSHAMEGWLERLSEQTGWV